MFDRIVCLNLDRRPDRWAAFHRDLQATAWPLADKVVRVPAVDGRATGAPDWWIDTLGAWGCYRSHLRIWEDALTDGIDSLLVFEDDAVFATDFAEQFARVMDDVPTDWDQIYFGGEYLHRKPSPVVFKRSVLVQCANVNRTHCYAMRRWFLQHAYTELSEPVTPPTNQHVDHRLGDMHDTGAWNIYAPWRFIVGQRAGVSDVILHPPLGTPTQWFNQFPIEEPAEQLCHAHS